MFEDRVGRNFLRRLFQAFAKISAYCECAIHLFVGTNPTVLLVPPHAALGEFQYTAGYSWIRAGTW